MRARLAGRRGGQPPACPPRGPTPGVLSPTRLPCPADPGRRSGRFCRGRGFRLLPPWDWVGGHAAPASEAYRPRPPLGRWLGPRHGGGHRRGRSGARPWGYPETGGRPLGRLGRRVGRPVPRQQLAAAHPGGGWRSGGLRRCCQGGPPAPHWTSIGHPAPCGLGWRPQWGLAGPTAGPAPGP